MLRLATDGHKASRGLSATPGILARIIADTPGGYRPTPHMFRKIFSRVKVASQIVCLYLVSVRSYKTSKMTILKMSLQQCNIFAIMADASGARVSCTHFRKLFPRDTMPLSSTIYKLFRFKVENPLNIFKNSAYLSFWGGCRGYLHKLYIFRKLFSRATLAS